MIIDNIIEIKSGTTFNEVIQAIRNYTQDPVVLKQIFDELVEKWLQTGYIVSKKGLQIK